MSKSGATSANLKPCNVDNAELHCNVEHRKELANIRHDLTSQNVAWHSYDKRTLRQCFDDACKLYESSTGQKPQLGKVERFDIKTKRKRTIVGFAPIREMVVVIKPETTEEDIDRLCKEMQTRFGMTPLAFSMHFDEGHWLKDVDQKTGKVIQKWSPNLHAHLYFDIMERRLEDNKGKVIEEKKRGRTIKFTEKQMSLMQDIAARNLGMDRGEKGGQCRTNDNIYEYQRDAQLKELSGLTMQTNERKVEISSLSDQIAYLTTQIEDIQSKSNIGQEEYSQLCNSLSEKKNEFDEISCMVESQQEFSEELRKTNNQLVLAQDNFAKNIGGELRKQAEVVKAAIEDTSAKKTLFGSKKDQEERRELRENSISLLREVIENPTAHLTDIMDLPENIRQEYRRMDNNTENKTRNDKQSLTISKTNADLRRMHSKDAQLLDEMNMQLLSRDVKDLLMDGKNVSVRQKWYDPDKGKYTDEEEAMLDVSEGRLKYNGKTLKDFLYDMWVKMARIARELRESTQQLVRLRTDKSKGMEI